MNALEKYAAKRVLTAKLQHKLKTAGLWSAAKNIWGGVKNIFTGSPAANFNKKLKANQPAPAPVTNPKIERGIEQAGGMGYKPIPKPPTTQVSGR